MQTAEDAPQFARQDFTPAQLRQRRAIRTHAEEARRYATLKYQLAAKYREDRHGYTDAKGPFIWEIMLKADRWSQEIGWEPGSPDA